MSAPELRPYQRETIDAVIAARRRGVRRMVVCLPTGAGKTVIFSHLARMATRQVLVLAHREELLAQAADKLSRALEGTRVVGLERGASRAPAGAKVLVASLRSLHPDRIGDVLGGRDLGLIIYDECHHAPAEDNLRVLRTIGAFESDWPARSWASQPRPRVVTARDSTPCSRRSCTRARCDLIDDAMTRRPRPSWCG